MNKFRGMVSVDAKEFIRLKDRVESLQRKADRAEGALEQWRRQLHKEFDCHNVDEAKKLLVEMERQQQQLDEEYQKAVKIFERKWGDKL